MVLTQEKDLFTTGISFHDFTGFFSGFGKRAARISGDILLLEAAGDVPY